MRRTPLRKESISDPAKTKKRIQALLRSIVIVRDGATCILNGVGTVKPCSGFTKAGQLILQGDHLVTRGNNATYGDSRLVVCICLGHHGWKSLGDNLRKGYYDKLVRTRISPERVALWDRAEEEMWRPYPMRASDWLLVEVALAAELREIQKRCGRIAA